MSRKRIICVIALIWIVALVVVSIATSGMQPPYAYFRGEFPPSMTSEFEEVVETAAAQYDLYPKAAAWRANNRDPHAAYGFSLDLLTRAQGSHMPLHATVSGHQISMMFFDNRFYERAVLTAAELDALIVDVVDGLEGALRLNLCREDIDRGLCVRPARPRLRFSTDLDGARSEEDIRAVHDATVRHGVRFVVTWDWQLEKIFDVKDLFEVRIYAGRGSFLRGEFPLLFTNAPAGDRLTLSVFDHGSMLPDDVDALVRDVKSTLERRDGRRFCRTHPDTGVCDAEHRELENQRAAWVEARSAGTAAAVEGFLATHSVSRHADAARQRLARLHAVAAAPPPAPPPAAEHWVGRSPGETFADMLDDGSRGPHMTVVPAGVFNSGCASGAGCRLEEAPVHPVRVIRPFAMSTREATHAEYFRFARPDKRLERWWADRPATHLTWAEAAAYAAWLSERTGNRYRLPTEAEWEWAARALTGTAYPWGNEAGRRQARCAGCGTSWPSTSMVAPTGSYPPNRWGLFDMHGNAAEWTADCWHRDHAGAPADGSARTDGDCSRRVVRGGSYDTPPRAIRSAARVGKLADERYLDTGFRVLRELRNVEARAE